MTHQSWLSLLGYTMLAFAVLLLYIGLNRDQSSSASKEEDDEDDEQE